MLKSIVFDLDDTICKPNHEYTDTYNKYSRAEPINEVINKINLLHDLGYYVIISTARRMLTHDGDINKIIEDVGDVTEAWLDEHGVNYDNIIFGKPYSSTYYIDDKAMNVDDFLEWNFDE